MDNDDVEIKNIKAQLWTPQALSWNSTLRFPPLAASQPCMKYTGGEMVYGYYVAF
jgi:hypothetical protein